MIKAAIFDVDGTLLDSMPIWKDAGVRYLKSIHVEPEPGLQEILWSMSIPEGVSYLKKQYQLDYTKEEIAEGILSALRSFYYYEAPLKPGVKEFLAQLKEKGIPMVIATSSDRGYLEAAFRRTGIEEYFDRIFTCEEVGAGKTKSTIYEVAGNYLGSSPKETYVFEDVLHAVKSAKSANFTVIGIYDEASEQDKSEIRQTCDIFLDSFLDAEAVFRL